MELQAMKTFVTVVRYGSFSKAADSLGYSQGAVTIQVRNLEEELNVRLLDRIGKKISLTNRGQIFYEHAISVLNEFEKAKESVEEDTELTGKLRIGTINSLCSSDLPDKLHRFCQEHPKTSLSVVTDTPSVLKEMLARNELDLIYLLDNKVEDPHLHTVEICTAPIVFAARAGHPLADGGAHTLKEVSTYPLMLTEANASYRKKLDAGFREKGLEVRPAFEAGSPGLILRMLSQADYISFLPEFSIRQEEFADKLVKIEVPEFTLDIHLQVLYHKEKWVTREMRAFMELL